MYNKLILLYSIGLCSFVAFGHLGDPSHWDDSPAIEVDGIWKAHNQEWFHISQSCDLTIAAMDEDTHCTDPPDGGNHVMGSECEWYGDNLTDYSGITTTWQPWHWTDGDTISACVEDDPDSPGGSYSDDGSENTPSVTLKAWETMVHLSVANTVTGLTDANTLTESGYAVEGQDTVTSASIESTLAKGPVTAQTTETGQDSTLVVYDNGPHQFNSAEANATWAMSYIPQNAVVYQARGKYTAGASMSGNISTSTQDDDIDFLPSDQISVSLVPSIPNSPLGVRVSTNITITDDCESAAGIGFGFTSNLLSDCLSNTYTIDDQSGKSDPSAL